MGLHVSTWHSLAQDPPLRVPARRRQLLEDKEVHFAGYRVPHPLEPAIQVKVQTRSDHPSPIDAVDSALNKLTNELNMFSNNFERSLKAYVHRTGAKAATGDADDPMRLG